jgi:hypothetical protein
MNFIDMMIDHLTERGVMDPRLLYASPFTDIDPLGVAGVFGEGEVVQLIKILEEVQGRAAAWTRDAPASPRKRQSKRKPNKPPVSVSSDRRVLRTTPSRSIASGNGRLSKISEFIVTMY